MEVFLDLNNYPAYLDDYAVQFCEQIKLEMKIEFAKRVPSEKFKDYYENLVNQTFMTWKVPTKVQLSLGDFSMLFLKSLELKMQDRKLYIQPSWQVKYPGSSIAMNRIYNYFAFGDGNLTGIHQLPLIFTETQRNINARWEQYLQQLQNESSLGFL